MTLLLSKKQQELLRLQEQIQDIKEKGLRTKLLDLNRQVTSVTDEKPENTLQDRIHAAEIIEAQQEVIINDLQIELAENLRHEKYGGTKIEEKVTAWLKNKIRQHRGSIRPE